MEEEIKQTAMVEVDKEAAAAVEEIREGILEETRGTMEYLRQIGLQEFHLRPASPFQSTLALPSW